MFESKRFPESAVTVWATVSLLTHVTFVPALIESAPGVNEKFFIPIVTEGADGIDGGGGGSFAGIFELETMGCCGLFT